MVRQLHENGETLPFHLEVIAFAEEEGVRFGTSYLGSSAVAGRFNARNLERRDSAGMTVGDAIRFSGSDPGRIVALADVYDALTSKRCYKEAFRHELARGIILDSSGSHFDPDVVDAFIEAESEFIAVAERFGEQPQRVG